MRTAEEILIEVTKKHTGTGYSNRCILEAMEIYANEKLDNAADGAEIKETTAYSVSRDIVSKNHKLICNSVPGIVKTIQVDKESILKLKGLATNAN